MDATEYLSELTVSRTTTNHEPEHYITVDIVDRGRNEHHRLRVSLADFALIITGRGGVMVPHTKRPIRRKP